MSIDGPIFMPDMKEKNIGQKCATVLDYRLELKGQNPYGELIGGWLKIEAPLAEVIDGKIFEFGFGSGNLTVFVDISEEEFETTDIHPVSVYNGRYPLDYFADYSRRGQWRALLSACGEVTNRSWEKKGEIPDRAVCILV
jgi:hypothetical protein